ncbi:ImcF-related family protein [Xenorhabdus szentirmaii]|uniref:ImcF-related family protein n=1 Tax=Xenorhabdus szentirmaii TaxID=290112 RepID=UPI00199114C7|nr:MULTISPECIES: ImcF-related family protein [unclassified Xenorhabdus]MBD2791100.1 hypothetical protein [Xenorhabdus sp. CUL]MBD2825272.1 hypothetical protein [Xenorhabdus sp. 5]
MSSRDTESEPYQTILSQVANHYADMTLHDMVGETDATLLWHVEGAVPGVFTRRTWEETVQPTIEKVVNERKHQIDWVLSDHRQTANDDASPETLKIRLTQRYFTDFAAGWRTFLNGMRWKATSDMTETVNQLHLIADIRQSPLFTLMNTLSYQGKTGQQKNSLLTMESNDAELNAPLASSFSPILSLVESQASSQQGTLLSVSGFMTRTARVHLNLQQVTQSSNPQEASQLLAKTIMQGRTLDLANTRDYGQRIAEGLGSQWRGLGQALSVAPMSQSWQQLLTPTAQSVNTQWKTAIVDKWNAEFSAHYPFTDAVKEASLPVLAQYIRANDGHIPRLLESNLSGVLQKEGSRWVPNPTQSQGLTFNPAFLKALDTLNLLSETVFANGEARLNFELQAGTTEGVMQTTLTIDHQTLDYANQMPFWKTFIWPNDTTAQGTTLSWVNIQTGERIYADKPVSWGLIRLLEMAKVTRHSQEKYSHHVQWQAQDGRRLVYILRTKGESGPLLLLKLRHFSLPEQIFLNK